MRFKYSYLRGVRQYVQLERPAASEKGKEKAVDVDGGEEQEGEEERGQEEGLLSLGTREIVQVQWGRILWITTRDQVISPLLQGALWCVVSISPPLDACRS